VRLGRPQLTTPLLMWFGLLGAPGAWALQHTAGIFLTEANCRAASTAGGWQIHLDAWTIVLTAGGLLIALAAGAAAVATFRRTRDQGEEPPASRIHFLSVVAITVTPLFIFIMLMSGLGVIFLVGCRQS
jgi:heme/copper-type cytochrome/quinol oxidase subunit 2